MKKENSHTRIYEFLCGRFISPRLECFICGAICGISSGRSRDWPRHCCRLCSWRYCLITRSGTEDTKGPITKLCFYGVSMYLWSRNRVSYTVRKSIRVAGNVDANVSGEVKCTSSVLPRRFHSLASRGFKCLHQRQCLSWRPYIYYAAAFQIARVKSRAKSSE